MADRYTITFTAQGLAYVRQLLGRCPIDEALPLFLDLERQKGEQDRVAGMPPISATAVADLPPRAEARNGQAPDEPQH